MLGANSSIEAWRRVWSFAARSITAAIGVALVSWSNWDASARPDTDRQPDEAAALLRAFDALCVATRFDEKAFHASVSLFSKADEIPRDVLHMLSPSNTAGYFLTDSQGDRMAAVVGLVRSDDIESRNCGVTSSVGFDAARRLVANRFPVELVDQFYQGVSEFVVFQGRLAGYSGNLAISVQGDYDLSTVSIYELPDNR